MTARVLSLQVGTTGTVPYRGNQVATAIDKRPVEGRLTLGRLGFTGDEQADLTVHGGPDKAACCYPSEHFPHWAQLLGRDTMPFGAFGENLTLQGASETDVRIGDVYALGDAVVQVSQPRGPCFKIAARWGRRTITNEMAKGLIAGFYLRVLQEGPVGAGDTFNMIERGPDITVADVLRVTYVDRHDDEARRHIAATPALADQWRAALA